MSNTTDRLAESDWETIQQLRRDLGRAEAKVESLTYTLQEIRTNLKLIRAQSKSTNLLDHTSDFDCLIRTINQSL